MSDPGPPTSYLALAEGTRVVGADGQQVGTVRHVLAATDKDVFDGLVLDTPDGTRFADARFVGDLYENEARLTIDSGAAAALPEPSENPATVDVQLDDVAGSGSDLGDKLRRAWDLLSGRY
jgi:hypothetical protein